MVDDKDSVQLSEYCFNVCEILRNTFRGKNASDVDESEKMAMEGLERCVGDVVPFYLQCYQTTLGLCVRSSEHSGG